MNNIVSVAGPFQNHHFAVHEHCYTDNNGIQQLTRLLVIKDDKYNSIVDFAKCTVFCGKYTGEKSSIYDKNERRHQLYHIADALNYLFKENYMRYKITKLSEVTVEMLFDCFDAYIDGKKANSNEPRGKQSIKRFIFNVSSFFANMALLTPGCAVTPEELFADSKVYSKDGKLYKLIKVPAYKPKQAPKVSIPKLERNMSPKAFDLLVSVAEVHDPMLVFPLILGETAGLRIGQICNVLQAESPLTDNPCISFRRYGDIVQAIVINITKELPVRGDGKNVGKIKPDDPDILEVYPPFIERFLAGYSFHVDLLKKVSCKEASLPMFINKYGYAMTEGTLAKRFNTLVEKHFIPALFNSGNPFFVAFAQDLQTKHLRFHVARHVFTVKLVKAGLTKNRIADYRGDKSTVSAEHYILNKGSFADDIAVVHNQAINDLLAYHNTERSFDD